MQNINRIVTCYFLLSFCLISLCATCSAASFKGEVDWLTKEELAKSHATEIFDYSYTPDPNVDIWGLLELKLYIPSSITWVRGIYCYVPGWQGSSMVMLGKKSLRTYVEEKGFALMTFTTEGEYTSREEGISRWAAKAFLDGVKELAAKSGHPEVEHAPLLFNGHSAGGQFGYHFTLLQPERVIAFVTIKGGLHSLTPAGDAAQVPGFMVIGEKDEEFRKANLTTIFKKHRKQKALWSLAMHRNSKHEPVRDDLKHVFFDAVIPLRLAAPVAEDSIPRLKAIDESAAWLGNSESFTIKSYDNYQGDKSKASWLPNEEFAKSWLEFIKK